MATFLLIHGAWFGGWIWKRVTPLLRAAGHESLKPTLTGLGERAHLARPEVSLYTHVQDVRGVLAYEDVRGVVLVGWSYAGMVITAVAEQAADRLARLVYLDASVPEDGQAALDLLDPATRAAREERVRTEGQGWQMLPPPVEQFGITAEADARWVRPKLVAQPFKTCQEPVRLTNAAARLPRRGVPIDQAVLPSIVIARLWFVTAQIMECVTHRPDYGRFFVVPESVGTWRACRRQA
jgi:pimeloyl-ACP methyl ester carboxylesterase